MFSKIYRLVFRNNYSRNGEKLPKKKVHLEYYKDAVNLGDVLSPVVCEYMLARRALTFSSPAIDHKPTHLTAIGSILGGRGEFNMTVWGSGVRNFGSVKYLCRRKFYQKLDIRAVRGPVTYDALTQCGISCPQAYGDPAVLMPMIYAPEPAKRHGTVVITHYLTPADRYDHIEGVTFLDIKTKDYKSFIDAIASAEKVISSSLHGIILAETYGTPATFLKEGIETELLKFYDWYYATGRTNVLVCSSMEQALNTQPMPLPDLQMMQAGLMETFPYDLWECS